MTSLLRSVARRKVGALGESADASDTTVIIIVVVILIVIIQAVGLIFDAMGDAQLEPGTLVRIYGVDNDSADTRVSKRDAHPFEHVF